MEVFPLENVSSFHSIHHHHEDVFYFLSNHEIQFKNEEGIMEDGIMEEETIVSFQTSKRGFGSVITSTNEMKVYEIK
jgi:hypothetical protein